jgi:hypothetical protein
MINEHLSFEEKREQYDTNHPIIESLSAVDLEFNYWQNHLIRLSELIKEESALNAFIERS